LGERFSPRKKQTGIGTCGFSENHILMWLICFVLNADFWLCGALARLHIYLPGLLVLAICRKNGGDDGIV
jgi:hypothetical protein